uniref:Cytochrome P450 n=1 Tax=Timema cristinae TaxID=61476 RepID=A0A7R9D1Y7_TIMCR|nr:unnamed protein product [Timema cristinae]
MGFVLDSLLLELFLISASLLALLYYYLSRNEDYWKSRGVPFIQPTTFFGNLKDVVLMRTSEPEQLARLYFQLEGHSFGGIFQSVTPTLLLRDPELIKTVLVKDFDHFHDRGIPLNEEKNPLGAHLITLEGSRWKTLRSKLTPAFTSGKLKNMFQFVVECAQDMTVHLEEKVPDDRGRLEIKEIFAKYTTNVIGSCGFGLRLNTFEDPHSKFRRMGREFFEPTYWKFLRRWIIINVPVMQKLKISAFSHEMTSFFMGIVKETIGYRESNGVMRSDFLQLLIELKNRGRVDLPSSNENVTTTDGNEQDANKGDLGLKLTDSLLTAQCFMFFMAGFETSSTTMSFCVYELAINPEVQDRLLREVDETLLKTRGEPTYQDISTMDYLDSVIKETLRKYPVVHTLMRVCTRPYTLPGTNLRLEAGTKLVVPLFGLHYDPRYHPDPHRFDPERFSGEGSRPVIPAYTYLPFGEGPRNCIGLRFGLMQVKAGLVYLLSKYKLSSCDKTTVPPRFDPRTIVASPLGGVWLKVPGPPRSQKLTAPDILVRHIKVPCSRDSPKNNSGT